MCISPPRVGSAKRDPIRRAHAGRIHGLAVTALGDCLLGCRQQAETAGRDRESNALASFTQRDVPAWSTG
jgi:hypothetical protein